MSPSKRQKIEEYHDPDYCQDDTTVAASVEPERQDKIKMIIKREFAKEITAKEEEINLIDHKLSQAKRLLQRVRYAVAMSYYTKQNLVHSANELKCDSNAPDRISSSAGQAIHPSLKKLLGKKPIDYEEILKNRSPRNAAKAARSTLIKSKKKETAKPDKDVTINEMKIPRYISPTKPDIQIEKINSSRGRNQTSHLIVVGNTSKYIGDEKSANDVTHKWLVYIKTKGPVGIEDMVSKVRFFLHPSYKPNDVIEVDSPPFQISRRGWGEFPIRAQLYFHDSINQKPLQIFHNLILDKKMTGLQTMGAETVVEIWLNLPMQSRSQTESKIVPSTNVRQERKTETPNATVNKQTTNKIEKHQAAGVQIKMEEPLIINESMDVESHDEPHPESHENPFDLHDNKSETKTKSSQGCLSDIDEIFKDAVAAPKTELPVKVDSVKLTTPPVQQKKTLVRCLDSNGKIVFVQLQVDPNNPKNIKFVKAPSVIATTQPTPLGLAKPANVTQLKLSTPLEQRRPVTTVTNVLSNTSNSTNQHIKITPSITSTSSTLLHPKPIVVKSNANLSRLNPGQAKSLLENKKLFIIKSSALPNSNAAHPPPLVRISNPNKIVLAPNTTNVKVMQPSSNTSDTPKVTINSNSAIIRNGKIVILDKEKVVPKPKQESLLKPQVSLLKPVYQKQVTESTSTNANSMPKPSQILGSRYRKTTPLSQNPPKRDFHKEFVTVFLRHSFQTVRSAVEYILKNTPLINTLSSRPEFNAAFPFVVESHEKLDSFPFPKRRLNEWYRAKFVLRMIQQHPDVKNELSWLTREIIIFGRRFGYTPANIVTLTKRQPANQNPLQDMIKQHIKEEQLKNVTLTYSHRIKDFMKKYDDLTIAYSITPSDPLEIVDIDGDDVETATIEAKPKPTQLCGDKLMLDVNKIMQSEGVLVNDICHDIQIKLDKEEIVDGVLCSSSQLMLWQAMRSFMEDLIRRSFATKPLAEQISDLSADRCVRLDDLRRAISTTENFGFLTNKHLGKKSS